MSVSATATPAATTKALALYDARNLAPGRAPLRTDPRFRAGVVMEALERRRVLSTTASGVPALGNLNLDANPTAIVGPGSVAMGGIIQIDPPITIDDPPTSAGDGAGNDASGDSSQQDDGSNSGDGSDSTGDPCNTCDTGDSSNDGSDDSGDNSGDTSTDGGVIDDNGGDNGDGTTVVDNQGGVSDGTSSDTNSNAIHDWPNNYAWTLDRAPTQADVDAFNAGNTTGWFNLDDMGVVDGVNVDALVGNWADTHSQFLGDGSTYNEDGTLVPWPNGFAWIQDSDLTQADLDAFAAGNRDGWLKITDALGISDQTWADYNAQRAASDNWWYEWDVADTGGQSTDGLPGDVAYMDGGVMTAASGEVAAPAAQEGNIRVSAFASGPSVTPSGIVTQKDAGKPTGENVDSSQQGFGGIPASAPPQGAAASDLNGSIVLGKVKRGVTDDDPSDLPFLN